MGREIEVLTKAAKNDFKVLETWKHCGCVSTPPVSDPQLQEELPEAAKENSHRSK